MSLWSNQQKFSDSRLRVVTYKVVLPRIFGSVLLIREAAVAHRDTDRAYLEQDYSQRLTLQQLNRLL